jgi:hypothetical protein
VKRLSGGVGSVSLEAWCACNAITGVKYI